MIRTNKYIKALFKNQKRPKFLLNKLFYYVLNIDYRFIDLETITLYVNSVCNLKCKMCDVGMNNRKGIDIIRAEQKKTNLDINLLKKLLNDPYIKKRRIIFNIALTEPLLHPKIEEIVRLIKEKRHFVKITTSGLLLPSKAEGLVKAGLDEIQVSIYGNEEINKNITGVDISYKNAIEGIRKLNGKVRLLINCTVTNLNYFHITDFLESINNEGIRIDTLKFLFMEFVSSKMKEQHNKISDIKHTESCVSDIVNPENVDAKELSEKLKSIRIKDYENIKEIDIIPFITDEEGIRRYFNNKGEKIKGNDKCFIIWSKFAFNTDGKVSINMRCFNYSLGDFNNNTIKEIFVKGKLANEFRRKMKENDYCFPACTRCCGTMRYGKSVK